MLLVGPAATAAFVLVLTDLFIASWSVKFLLCGVGTACCVAALAALLYSPTDALLPAAIVHAESISQLANERLGQRRAADGLDDILKQLRRLRDERSEQEEKLRAEIAYVKRQIAYVKRERSNLLQENWRSLRGDDWEDFLVTVFCSLGANAKRTNERCSSDQGVDLIVEFAGQRIAVQAKGYGFKNHVSNKAVQEAYTGAQHWGCGACAVITNSRFIRKAKELADSTNCVLIANDEFPDLVLGRITIWEKPVAPVPYLHA